MRLGVSILTVIPVILLAGAWLPGSVATQPASRSSVGVDDGGQPIVIGHRGASGFRPEHTLAAYELAIDMGVDFIEPDLVMTRDGVLVARHENEISGTTDVAQHAEFADRRATKTIDGQATTGWFTEDFTLDELKTLRARERLPALRPANTLYDDTFEVPTFAEIIDLARARGVGIYPETKHPTYFDGLGLSLEEPLVALLHGAGYRASDPVFIQSFEVGNLQELAGMTELPLVQLLSDHGAPYDQIFAGDARTYADMATPAGLAEIASYAQGVGVHKGLVVPRDESGHSRRATRLVDDAHAAGLVVHVWTFRDENTFLPAELREGDPGGEGFARRRGKAMAEIRRFLDLGVDGVFSDHPSTAVRARRQR